MPRRSGRNNKGNYYTSSGDSYHYSNSDGSYYYRNADGSTYYNSGSGYSRYTSASGTTRTFSAGDRENVVGIKPFLSSPPKQDGVTASLKTSSADDKKNSIGPMAESNVVHGSTTDAKKDPSVPTSLNFISPASEKNDGNAVLDSNKFHSNETSRETLNTSEGGISSGTQPPTVVYPDSTTTLTIPVTLQYPKASVTSKTVESTSESLEINPPPPKSYQTQTLEHIMNSFSSALEEDTLELLHEAQRVTHYDAVLRDSQRSISEIASQVSQLLARQSESDRTLTTVRSYQQTLSNALDGLETQIEELFVSQKHSILEDSDREREIAFTMSLNCESRLETMEEQLENVLKEWNEYQDRALSSGFDGDKDVAKLVEVMNLQYDSLSELESASRELEASLRFITQKITGAGA